ncbi:hypothetical protein EC991_005678 [Linnemannia zychae]|nr:hypothetical protein EC991_005678 [Linnemannia zychae]
MPSLLTRNRVTLALRVFILAQSIVSAFLSYFAIERYFRASKYVGWHSLSSGKVNIPIYCAFIASAIVRAIVSFSSRIILARVALYVWALDLAGRIAITGYNISTAQSDIYTLAYVLSSRQIWIDLGAYILAGVGLKMILDEARGSNLRALQRRVETVQGLDKDEKEGAVSTGQVQGTSGRAEEKEDEDEPQTLRNFVSKRWVAFGFFFLTEMSENKRRIILAGHCQCK